MEAGSIGLYEVGGDGEREREEGGVGREWIEGLIMGGLGRAGRAMLVFEMTTVDMMGGGWTWVEGDAEMESLNGCIEPVVGDVCFGYRRVEKKGRREDKQKGIIKGNIP